MKATDKVRVKVGAKDEVKIVSKVKADAKDKARQLLGKYKWKKSKKLKQANMENKTREKKEMRGW